MLSSLLQLSNGISLVSGGISWTTAPPLSIPLVYYSPSSIQAYTYIYISIYMRVLMMEFS